MDSLDAICSAKLTPDYWTITLPNELATSAARSPTLYAYYAALVLLDAKALFSQSKVSELLDPWIHSTKSALERHHLFPKAYLEKKGVTSRIEVNELANFALAEWSDNNSIRDQAPAKYVPKFKKGFSGAALRHMHYWHALPDGWEEMDYADFVERRRELMSKVIRDGFETLAPEREVEALVGPTVASLVAAGESDSVEFKSTLRRNLHTGKHDEHMELAVVKTIAGFLNGSGGELVIGVADDGTPVGVDADGFSSEDKMSIHLINVLNARMGATHGMYIHPRFEDYDGVRVLRVVCNPARSPVYVKDGSVERFYVRTGPATAELPVSAVSGFVQSRFA